jgi:hypothetical protein
MSFLVGLDLGQARDYTAVAVVERLEDQPSRYAVRHLERFPLGTAYPAIVEAVTALLRRPPLWKYTPLVVDATGVGAPVADLLRRAGLVPVLVKIHGGQSVTRDDEGAFRVPKRDLASVLAVLLQSRRLHVAASLRDAAVLVTEMLAFKVKISAGGTDMYEAWRERDHDDLVLAVALACWYGEHHAGVPVFKGYFSVEKHVSQERVTPQPGLPIIRGWRTMERAAVVWFQVDHRGRCRVLYELAPDTERGLRATKGQALSVSNILFPRFEFFDYGVVETREGDPSAALSVLQPEVLLIPGEASPEKQRDAAHRWLAKFVGGAPAVEIDPGCTRLITALAGGYAFRRVHGHDLGEIEENAHTSLVDAWLCALAHPVAALSPAQRARLAGPRSFVPPV